MSTQVDKITADKLQLLRALAAAYERSPQAARQSLLLSYMLEAAELLAHQFGDEKPLRPLLDTIETMAAETDAVGSEERRTGDVAPSPALLGRIAACLDTMIDARFAPATAAQAIARQMLRASVEMPMDGGDSRGWMRLIAWAERLRRAEKPPAAWKAYCELKGKLHSIYGADAGMAAMSAPLWDARDPAGP